MKQRKMIFVARVKGEDIRLIDADAYAKEMEDRYNSAINWGKRAVASHDDEMRIRAEQASFSFVEAAMTAKKMPTIDAVEVVRCKDCRWGREACGNIECSVDCNLPPEYHGYEWFCPNGERMNNE